MQTQLERHALSCAAATRHSWFSGASRPVGGGGRGQVEELARKTFQIRLTTTGLSLSRSRSTNHCGWFFKQRFQDSHWSRFQNGTHHCHVPIAFGENTGSVTFQILTDQSQIVQNIDWPITDLARSATNNIKHNCSRCNSYSAWRGNGGYFMHQCICTDRDWISNFQTKSLCICTDRDWILNFQTKTTRLQQMLERLVRGLLRATGGEQRTGPCRMLVPAEKCFLFREKRNVCARSPKMAGNGRKWPWNGR